MSAEQIVRPLVGGQYGLGYNPEITDLRDFTKETLGASQKLPDETKEVAEAFNSKVDIENTDPLGLKEIDFIQEFTPIRNQLDIGSCTWASTDGVIGDYNKTKHGVSVQSSILFGYKVTRNLENVPSGDVGATIRGAMKALLAYGWVREKDYPYITKKFDNPISQNLLTLGQLNQGLAYIRHDKTNQNRKDLLVELKKYLTRKIPIIFGFTVYDSIEQANLNGGLIPFPAPDDKIVGGHAIVMCGYNDNLVIKNSNNNQVSTKGAFIIRNSWSDRWGNHGYGALPYQYILSELALDFWSLLDLEWIDTAQFD